MKEFKVTYYGLDKEILPLIEKEVNTFISVGNKISFSHVLPDDGHKNLCELMEKGNTDLLLIDLSLPFNIDQALRILYYEVQVQRTIIVGLWNQLENPNLSKWHFELGINIHFCYQVRDSGSIESLILSIVRLLNLEKKEFGFYQKPLNREIEIRCPIRINFFDVESGQIESDIPLKKDDLISCVFPSIPDFPFNDFMISSISKINLNYPLEYQGNLDYFFYDEFGQAYMTKWDHLSEIEYIEIITQNPVIAKNLDENQVREIISQFSKNKSASNYKKTIIKRMIDRVGKLPDYDIFKNLIIDKTFSAFKNSGAHIWDHPYKFLMVSTIEDNLNVLNTCGAQLITYALDKKLNLDNFEDSIEFIQLKTICSRFNNLNEKFGTKPPIVLIFNLEIEHDKLTEMLNYKELIVKNTQFEFKDNLALIKEIISNPKYKQDFKLYNKQSFKLYPNSMSELSRGFLVKKVDLLTISENEVIFKSNLPIQKGFSFILKLEGGSEYFATIYEIKREESENIFHGIINSLNAKEQTELRKIIIKG